MGKNYGRKSKNKVYKILQIMKQLIDKDALVVEIKRYKHKADERLKIKGRSLAEERKDSALQNLCGNLLYFIDTLEVKEVDLEEKACDAYCKVCGHYAHTTSNHICRQACDYYKNFVKYMKRK